MNTMSKQHASTAEREIITSRLVNAPRALVWKVFTDPTHLSHWWGPNGFWSSTREYNFRVGGMWLFMMHGPDGRDYPNKVVFEDIDEPNYVFYKHMGEEDMSHVYFEAMISFEEQGDKTNVTLRSIFPTAQERDFVIENYGAVEGAVQTLTRLDEFVQHQQKKETHKLELTLPSDLEARFSRLFDAPREMVWKAWTDKEHLPKWMTGPDGWTMEVLENDLRPGGNWKYVWRKSDGTEMGMTGTFKEVIPPVKMVSTENWGGPFPQTVNHLVLTEENGKTRMTLTIIYPTKEARENALKTGMDDGMTVSFDRLNKLVTSL